MGLYLGQTFSRLLRNLPDSMKGRIFDATWRSMTEGAKNATRAKYQMASMEWSLQNIASQGFLPRNIVDVGAYHGDWTRMAKQIFPEAEILMVEAQPGKEELLRQVVTEFPGQITYTISLLGPAVCDKVTFYELETGSSVYAEQSNIEREVVQRSMETLDQVVANDCHGVCDLLKLDVQGYELEVLKGGSNVLRAVEVVLMEVSLLEVNRGAPLLHEVVQFMKDFGFVAYDICSFGRRPLDNALWQTDVIFVKQSSSLLHNQALGA